jgi:hypothetical protein
VIADEHFTAEGKPLEELLALPLFLLILYAFIRGLLGAVSKVSRETKRATDRLRERKENSKP